MLRVKQFRYNLDNLSYLIYGENQALAIDGGAAREIFSFIEGRKLNLRFVANTHKHLDHTSGNRMLLDRTHAQLLRHEDIINKGGVGLEGQIINMYNTPGHTDDSVCFHVNGILISGDTLFNGTIGNCFSGNLMNFYHSIKRLMMLPADTIIYAGHDYVHDAMNFAKKLEPENQYIDVFLNSYRSDHVFSTMADEMKVNPYLRFNEKSIIGLLKKNGLPCHTEWERWESLMSIE
ncbi:MAG TPA: MBL fold metallo-hydrolase [Syntrophales bacterium]|nr:MBL fold metallo-hydrolase [Syntrophales bacterium]